MLTTVLVHFLAHVPIAQKNCFLRNNKKLQVHLNYIYYGKFAVCLYLSLGTCSLTKKKARQYGTLGVLSKVRFNDTKSPYEHAELETY